MLEQNAFGADERRSVNRDTACAVCCLCHFDICRFGNPRSMQAITVTRFCRSSRCLPSDQQNRAKAYKTHWLSKIMFYKVLYGRI